MDHPDPVSVMEKSDVSAVAPQHEDRLTVHNFTQGSSATGASAAELLSTARWLVNAASTRRVTNDWVQRKEEATLSWVPGKLYAYSLPPPLIVVERRAAPVELKEWGAPVTEDEVWAMSELEGFESTRFLVPEDMKDAVESQCKKNLKRPRPSELSLVENRETYFSSEDEPAKRPRTSDAEVALQDVPVNKTGRCSEGEPIPELPDTKRAQSSESEAESLVQTVSERDERPRKQIKVDEGPLHGVIPRPHTFLTLMVSTPTQPTLLKAYKRTIPIPLAPYTNPLPEPSQWDRRAWIIPVRGTMPWANATGAEVLERRNSSEAGVDSPQADVPLSTEREEDAGNGALQPILKPIPPPQRSTEPVYWTREALRDFWEYLKVLRADGKLGSLGLTFYAAPKYRDGSIPSTLGQGNFFHFGIPSNRESFSGRTPPAEPSGLSEGQVLSSVDYVKVYHDAVQTMLLRTAIDIWPYQVRDDNGRVVEKIRVLKGAKLVLLDHLSNGVLVS